jgi:hypothetical protein
MEAPGISTLAVESPQVRILIVDEEEARFLCRDITVSLDMSVEITDSALVRDFTCDLFLLLAFQG